MDSVFLGFAIDRPELDPSRDLVLLSPLISLKQKIHSSLIIIFHRILLTSDYVRLCNDKDYPQQTQRYRDTDAMKFSKRILMFSD